MSGKKVLSLMIAVILAAGAFSTTVMAASKKKITSVNLTVKAEVIPGGSVFEQEAELEIRNKNITVGGYEFINRGFEWSERDIPRMEVTLYAENEYSFSVPSSGIKIQGGTLVSQKTEDSSLILTIDLPRTSESIQDVEKVEWVSSTAAGWSQAIGAGTYEVKLYRDGKTVGTVKTTGETTMDFGTSLTRVGSYTVRVRPINKIKAENKGGWTESAPKNVGEAEAANNRSTVSDMGWKQDHIGWWYKNADGSYTVSNWQYINGQWYYFNESGYMATGWIHWNGKQYYCDTAGGHMLANTQTPDGAAVGPDGARLP
ncbi:MAG: cell wall-binding protein [Lacrimispora sp.]|uniref:N-acetylmuramoyl-L-alanine amidase family protein n=1 Tax=Lacrimispora sp. TaxID=2719234 RepID=UPI0039E536B1